MRWIRLALLFLISPVAHAEQRWYVFSIGDTPVGYAVEDAEGSRTRNEVFARLTRLGKSIEMRFETVSVESARGDLESLTYEAVLSKQPMRIEVRVESNHIHILTPPHERTIDRGNQRLLGPRAIARLSAERLRAVGDSIQYSVFSPELQRVAGVKRVVVATEEAICGGIVGMRIEESMEGLPAPRALWTDATGLTIGDAVAGPFGPMRTCRATRAEALAANGTLPADLYEKTLAHSNVRFGDPFAIDRVVVRIRRRDAAPRLPELESHNQKALARTDDETTLEIRRDGGAAMPAADYLAPNALVESDHPEIVALASELKRPTPAETAHELTRWVAENLAMDAGIVMAPASELIRDRRATCVGYATLLAALGRAAGIPSRIVMGYVYYGGIWGGHAWTEVILDGRWVSLDAAVYAPGVASAARIAAGASSYADGGGDLTAALGTLFGQVDIDVIEYSEGGRLTRIPEGARAYLIAEAAYVNPGLGLRIPTDVWSVERADATWPSTLVVSFRRDANIVELHHSPRLPARPLDRDGEAMFVEESGGMLRVWVARGPAAGSALRQFLQ